MCKFMVSRKSVSLLLALTVLVSVLGLTIPSGSVALASAGAKPPQPVDIDASSLAGIATVLSAYSQALSSEPGLEKSSPPAALQELVQERQAFYTEYFEVGLYSTLESIRAEFAFDPQSFGTASDPTATAENQVAVSDAVISARGRDEWSVQVTEKVTLRGRYKTAPEQHPLVVASQWAIGQTKDERVKQGLKDRIQHVIADSQRSYKEGFETTIEARHSLVVSKTPSGFQIVQDAFTDQGEMVGGMDNVTWAKGKLIRNKPDFTTMPDYQRHVLPVEELGQMLLERATREYGGPVTNATLGSYNRWTARNYINAWTSNPSGMCDTCWRVGIPPWYPCGPYKDGSKWNSAYTGYKCTDCVNYVSQALAAGGHTTSSTWQPYTDAWKLTTNFYNWLRSSSRGYDESCTIAWEGDVAFTGDWGHVVMVSANGSPDSYSGHTNDRLNRAWDPSLTICVGIYGSYP